MVTSIYVEYEFISRLDQGENKTTDKLKNFPESNYSHHPWLVELTIQSVTYYF